MFDIPLCSDLQAGPEEYEIRPPPPGHGLMSRQCIKMLTHWEAALRDGRQAGALGGGAGLESGDVEVPVADALDILCLAVLHLGLRLPCAAAVEIVTDLQPSGNLTT